MAAFRRVRDKSNERLNGWLAPLGAAAATR